MDPLVPAADRFTPNQRTVETVSREPHVGRRACGARHVIRSADHKRLALPCLPSRNTLAQRTSLAHDKVRKIGPLVVGTTKPNLTSASVVIQVLLEAQSGLQVLYEFSAFATATELPH